MSEMNERDNDRQFRVDAEVIHHHIQDQARLIESRTDDIKKLMAPIKERRLRNHFTQEYEAVIKKGNR